MVDEEVQLITVGELLRTIKEKRALGITSRHARLDSDGSDSAPGDAFDDASVSVHAARSLGEIMRSALSVLSEENRTELALRTILRLGRSTQELREAADRRDDPVAFMDYEQHLELIRTAYRQERLRAQRRNK